MGFNTVSFCWLVLQAVSQQILVGFVDHLEITEPEDHHGKDEQELANGQNTFFEIKLFL